MGETAEAEPNPSGRLLDGQGRGQSSTPASAGPMLRSQQLPCGRSWQTSSPDGYVGGVGARVLRSDRWLTPLGPGTTTWVGCRLQRTLVLLYRRHFEHCVMDVTVLRAEAALERAGLARRRPVQPPAIAFLDLTGYTTLTEERGDQARGRAGRLAGWSRSSTSSPTATSCTGCTVRRQVRCRAGRRRESAATPAADAEGTAAARLPGPRRGTRLLAYGVAPSCIACMFLSMTASAVRSSSLGLNHTNSVPGSCCTGT